MASSLGSAALVKRCHVCGEPATIEPSAEAALDAPCPCCGNLIGPHPPAATRIRLSAFPILDQQTMQVFTRLDHWLDEA
jgi:hypothetical protein